MTIDIDKLKGVLSTSGQCFYNLINGGNCCFLGAVAISQGARKAHKVNDCPILLDKNGSQVSTWDLHTLVNKELSSKFTEERILKLDLSDSQKEAWDNRNNINHSYSGTFLNDYLRITFPQFIQLLEME